MDHTSLLSLHDYVVVQFSLCFKFYFPLFLGIVIYDNEFETKENKVWTKDKTEPQQLQHEISQFLCSCNMKAYTTWGWIARIARIARIACRRWGWVSSIISCWLGLICIMVCVGISIWQQRLTWYWWRRLRTWPVG